VRYHVAAATLLAIVGIGTVWGVRALPMPGVLGVRAFGYGSLVLLALALMIGPLARLWPKRCGWLMPARRAVGIWSALAAGLHLWFVLRYVRGWSRDWLTLVAQEHRRPRLPPEPGTGLPPADQMVTFYTFRMGDHLAVVSLFGYAAFAVLLVILLVSNDRMQRFLGQSSWKLIQQQAYIAFAFVAGHILLMKFGVKLKGSPPLLAWAPWLLLAVVLLQAAGFAHTVWKRRRAAPGPPVS
jgi:DMSO/TMAO reductase YedYZ heme-binding membrane subunit